MKSFKKYKVGQKIKIQFSEKTYVAVVVRKSKNWIKIEYKKKNYAGKITKFDTVITLSYDSKTFYAQDWPFKQRVVLK